jgi:hypothetical protein
MIARMGMVLVLALACLVVETNEVRAQCVTGGYGGFGYGGGYGFDVGRLYGVLAQNVPHFAAFPPVYYSAPVPRTYGYSPFAYPPGTATPDLPAPTMAAKEILNPYVPASTVTEKSEADKVTLRDSTPEPLAIVNPFVSSQVAEVTGPALHAVLLNR